MFNSRHVSVDSVVVATMEHLQCDVSIKNTFVHLNDESSAHTRASQVRRWKSEPCAGGEILPQSSFYNGVGGQQDDKVDCSSSSASTGLDAASDWECPSTPETSPRSSPAAWIAVSADVECPPTPETSPRNSSRASSRHPSKDSSPNNQSTPETLPNDTSADSSQAFKLCLVPFIVPVPAENSFAFSVKLRRVPGVELGISMGIDACTGKPMVCSVSAGSAVDSWNRVVLQTPQATKAIVPGDIIESVNGETAVSKICYELATRILVNVELRRWL